MTDALVIVAGVFSIVAGLVEIGYAWGVRDTERRWSDAVGRAEAQKEEK